MGLHTHPSFLGLTRTLADILGGGGHGSAPGVMTAVPLVTSRSRGSRRNQDPPPLTRAGQGHEMHEDLPG